MAKQLVLARQKKLQHWPLLRLAKLGVPSKPPAAPVSGNSKDEPCLASVKDLQRSEAVKTAPQRIGGRHEPTKQGKGDWAVRDQFVRVATQDSSSEASREDVVEEGELLIQVTVNLRRGLGGVTDLLRYWRVTEQAQIHPISHDSAETLQ